MQPPSHVPADRIVDIDIYLPPGLESQGFHKAWSDLSASNPAVVWTPRNEGHWIALGGEALQDVQSDPARFSSRVIVLPKSVGEMHGLIPTTIDPPEHRPYRQLLNAHLNPSAIRGLSDSIRATAVDLIEGFASRGHCNFSAEYAEQFPIRVFMALVGIDAAEAPKIRHWAECMTRPGMDMTFDEAKAVFFDYVAPLVDARRETPGEDMISALLHADLGEGRRLTRDEALSVVTQVLIAGLDTVVNVLGFIMRELAENAALRADLRQRGADIVPVVHELFRRFGLVSIAREVRHDIEFHGVHLKAGDMIAIPTQVHGLDPRVNPDPLTIDPTRKRARHSTFGSGPHMCPGQELARKEVAITLEEWLKRIPDFHLAADADTQCSGGIVGQVNRVVLEWDA